MTAIENDLNFKKIFSRQIEVVGQNDDIFIVILTGGNSKNNKYLNNLQKNKTFMH
jgi:phosphoheptose isomerase